MINVALLQDEQPERIANLAGNIPEVSAKDSKLLCAVVTTYCISERQLHWEQRISSQQASGEQTRLPSKLLEMLWSITKTVCS